MKITTLLIALILILPAFASGQAYFQQSVDYTIDVKLNDSLNLLIANESFVYTNNSPQTLDTLWMHIWPNAYKNNETGLGREFIEDGSTDFYYSDTIDRGYIDKLNFKIDNQTVIWHYHPQYNDICYLLLNTPLAPEKSITVSTPFRVKIPDGRFSRLGHVGQSYMITQWYPKPAVFDNKGWHCIPYLNQGEFYSEFGNYDVKITLPENYKLAATGDRINALEEDFKIDEEATKTSKINIYPRDMTFPPSSHKTKTIEFKQSKVHDFAWFADKRWHILKGEVTLPHSGRKVATYVYFTNSEASLWRKSIEYVNDAVYYYSLWNGDYQYDIVTAVDGTISAGGGMEYPNITVIGSSGDDLSLEQVIMHEVGHNWFYGMLGSNERDHAWMDEGINSFNEYRYTKTKYPKANVLASLVGLNENLMRFFGLGNAGPKFLYDASYLLNARRNLDQPCDITSHEYTQVNYGGMVYSKSAVVFDYLYGYLGNSLFDHCMQTYFDKWKFKHPYPEDIRKVFEDEKGEDLSWFFDYLIETNKKVDYAISKIKHKGDSTLVTVKNKGDIASPIGIATSTGDSTTVVSWYNGFEKKGVIALSTLTADKIIIDPNGRSSDLFRKNNSIKTSGLLKKVKPIKLKLLGQWDNPEINSLYWLPIMGWNNYDGYMAGIALYNSVAPQKKVEYFIAPLYSFATKDIAGSGIVTLNMFPHCVFSTAKLSLLGATYDIMPDTLGRSTYRKAKIIFDTHIKDKHLADGDNQYVTFWASGIEENMFSYKGWLNTSEVNKMTHTYTSFYGGLKYKFVRANALHSWTNTVDAEYGNTDYTIFGDRTNFGKIKVSSSYFFRYSEKGKRIYLRFFAGKYFSNTNLSTRFNLQLDGSNGSNDYLYDHVFLGRNEVQPGMLKQQYVGNEGQFRTPMNSGQSNDWILALNIGADVPLPIPLYLFADMGLYPVQVNGNPTAKLLYDAGLSLKLFSRNLQVNFPLFYSDDIKSEYDFNNITYGKRITFWFDINSFSPQRLQNLIPY